MAEKEVSPGGINTEKINGGQETPVIENNPPREQLKIGSKFVSDEDSNRETDVDGDLVVGKDLYVDGKMKIGGEIIEGDLEVDGDLTVGKSDNNKNIDVYGGITATGNAVVGGGLTVGGEYNLQNYSLYSNAAGNVYIGTGNANKTLNIYGELVINGRMGQPISQNDFLENLNANVTLSNFSAYKIGQLVFLKCVITTSSYTQNNKLFDIKSGFRPKTQYRGWCYNSNWGNNFALGTDGKVSNYSSATSESSFMEINVIYEIA